MDKMAAFSKLQSQLNRTFAAVTEKVPDLIPSVAGLTPAIDIYVMDLTGSTGFTGSTGSTGFTGLYDFANVTDLIGATGFTEPISFAGSTGFTGPTEYIGFIGYTGTACYTGGTAESTESVVVPESTESVVAASATPATPATPALSGPAITWRGDWWNVVQYNMNDGVIYKDVKYVAINNIRRINQIPSKNPNLWIPFNGE